MDAQTPSAILQNVPRSFNKYFLQLTLQGLGYSSEPPRRAPTLLFSPMAFSFCCCSLQRSSLQGFLIVLEEKLSCFFLRVSPSGAPPTHLPTPKSDFTSHFEGDAALPVVAFPQMLHILLATHSTVAPVQRCACRGLCVSVHVSSWIQLPFVEFPVSSFPSRLAFWKGCLNSWSLLCPISVTLQVTATHSHH